MIMPANYSVIAENELSYVDGGWVDPMTSTKILETNIAKAIGNSYAQKVMTAFIGSWFDQGDGNKNIFGYVWDNVAGLFTNGASENPTTVGKLLRGAINTVGVLGGIWVLGTQEGAVPNASGIKLGSNVSDPKPAYTIKPGKVEGTVEIWT